tara:strand:+ start:81 stop:239 length:159 start_codon:yes stop_codon:yes gene_type:complete
VVLVLLLVYSPGTTKNIKKYIKNKYKYRNEYNPSDDIWDEGKNLINPCKDFI